MELRHEWAEGGSRKVLVVDEAMVRLLVGPEGGEEVAQASHKYKGDDLLAEAGRLITELTAVRRELANLRELVAEDEWDGPAELTENVEDWLAESTF